MALFLPSLLSPFLFYMRILFITPSFPSRLARIRSYHFIKYLSRYHNIYLLSLHKKGGAWAKEEISPYCKAIHIVSEPQYKSVLSALFYLPTLNPLEVGYCRSKKLNREVKRLIVKYKIDLIYVKRLRSAQFVEGVQNLPVVIDTTDAMSLHYRRSMNTGSWFEKPLFFEEYLKYKWYEKRMLSQFPNWIVCSKVDRNYLFSTHKIGGAKIYIIDNGVDTEYYYPRNVLPEKNSILFSGIMYRHINKTAVSFFYREIFPHIKKEIPSIHLNIVGPNPPRSVRQLGKDPAVKVRGLAKDLREEILKNELVVCPLLTASGTRNKILQAWAMGRPVISTSIGAEGLHYEHGKDILIADNPQEFASHVIYLFHNERIRELLRQGGLQKIKEHYDMNIIVEKMNKVFCKITRR